MSKVLLQKSQLSPEIFVYQFSTVCFAGTTSWCSLLFHVLSAMNAVFIGVLVEARLQSTSVQTPQFNVWLSHPYRSASQTDLARHS